MRSFHRSAFAFALLCFSAAIPAAQAPRPPDYQAAAKQSLSTLDGTALVFGLHDSVEVLRDRWGVPHIFAKNTPDLFFAQGYVVAQDRMWQLEMWRRNGEGKLAEVLGPDYVTRDKFARLIAFRGNWDEEFNKYHPQGRTIFESFARGVNAAIQKTLDENKVPVEFQIMGFRPQPVWTAQTLLTRMPGWTLSRNASSEIQRALDVKAMGIAKVLELKPTDPEKPFVVPDGLDLADIDAGILAVTRDANNIRWNLTPQNVAKPTASATPGSGPRGWFVSPNPWLPDPDLGSNNWVVGGSKSVTGMPLIANDPHREVVNPALRYVVHLNAPDWNVIGATEPGLPGVSIGHNDRLAWGFTILGMDQQDVYVEETDPENVNRYRADGQWRDMDVAKELIWVRGQSEPVRLDVKLTRHGPVLHENAARHRAYALRWVGAEPGGAGYLGSLNVLQTKNWKEFNDALPKAWYIPSHSLVYADVDGNFGYIGVAQTPIRKNWDGLMPVPGKDSRYEWAGYVPFDKLPKQLNGAAGFYNSSNNDVVPKIIPRYSIPLGYEYSAPYRYERVHEVLSEKRKFSVPDMQRLQQDTLSLPARALVPLLKAVTVSDPAAQDARKRLLEWNFVLDRESVAASIYEFWVLKLGPLAFAPRLPDKPGASVRDYDMRRVIAWMQKPDRAYGSDPAAGRNRILSQALEQAVADLRKKFGDNMDAWKWGDIHTTDFVHPLAGSEATKSIFRVDPVRRGGDAFTVMAASSPTETSTKQTSGASFVFVMDTKDWDNSTGLNAPGNSAQPLSDHYKDLLPYWGDGKYFPLAFSRKKVEEVTAHRLVLQPVRDTTLSSAATSSGDIAIGADGSVDFEKLFEPVQPELFSLQGAQPTAWADFDGDGDLDLFVGFRGQMNRLYRNDNGHFVDVAAEVGLLDVNETRSAAWGDFDGDGDPDLFVGFAVTTTVPNRLYRNDGGKRFVDVAREKGVDDVATSRQSAFIDFDNDGDNDLFVAFRDRPNALYRNDNGKFVEVAKEVGIADPRKTVGAVWFDMDSDGDLDLFVANQDGDLNGFFRNDNGHFTDVAKQLGMDGAGRPLVYGGVGPSVVDYDNDGDLDLYVANYGPNAMYRNDGGGHFTDVAADLGIAGDYHAVTSSWGDFDNDGRPDVYVGAYLAVAMHVRDYLYRNEGKSFRDVMPSIVLKHDATHGVQWMDFDQDGDLDLNLADNGTMGVHFLFRNRLPLSLRQHGLNVLVLDSQGRFTRAGSEIRAYRAGTRTLLGTRLVDTGSGYCSQNLAPTHLGLPSADPIDIEVTTLTPAGRRITRLTGVDPKTLAGRPLVVKTGAASQTVAADKPQIGRR
ncbi:MAG TPA: penicillin acylase family protein [Vicinamibacterales bacterium]|nr:penicillin acylase family protein [Vicinamibacterales bacterium]